MKNDTLPDNPADAREMNRGRDVLKTYMPEPWLSATPARERQCVNACAGMADPAATIEALRGALETAVLQFDYTVRAMSAGATVSISSLQNCAAAAHSALALCARDGKGGAA